MGTSSSSAGPGAAVPFDPPWLNDIAAELGSPLEQIINQDSKQDTPQIQPGTPAYGIAPQRRFSNARRNLNDFIKTGNKESLKKALGNYSHKGMGGAANLANRMRTSTAVGAGLFNFLQGVRDNANPKIREWVNQLSNEKLSAYEVIDKIVNHILSTGGSIEEESIRNSMAQAMSDLLTIYPDVDLINMDNDSIWTVMELFIANEAFNRLCLDIGQLFERAESPENAVSRMNDMKEYLKSEISAQIQELKSDRSNLSKSDVNNILQSALRITFEIFEEVI